MQRKRQYGATVVSFPGTAAKSPKVVSASEISTAVPSGAEQRDGDDLRRYEAQRQRDVRSAIETGAIEISAVEIAVEIKDVGSRPGRLLAPPFGLFLRAALLAHLRRTFR